jgi:hypothetical protein
VNKKEGESVGEWGLHRKSKNYSQANLPLKNKTLSKEKERKAAARDAKTHNVFFEIVFRD